MAKLFGLYQQEIVKKSCWHCDGLMFGKLFVEGFGKVFVCDNDACPLEDKRMQFGDCMDGDVWLRKLLDLDVTIIQLPEPPPITVLLGGE